MHLKKQHIGVSMHGGTPKWMVYGGNNTLKWMTWGSPHIWEPSYANTFKTAQTNKRCLVVLVFEHG